MKTKKIFALLCAVTLATLLSGCESPVEREVVVPAWFIGDAEPAAELTQSPTTTPTPARTQILPTPPSQPAQSNNIEITLKDFEIVPNEISARPGKITFILQNAGRYTHNFRVDGQGIDVTGAKVGVGRTGKMEITLEAGVYHISCPISNHHERGMVGTLTVKGD